MFFKTSAILIIQCVLQASCSLIVNNCGQSINVLGTTYETVGLGITQNIAPATVRTINVPVTGLGGLGALGLGIGVNGIGCGGSVLGTGLVSYRNPNSEILVSSAIPPTTVGAISIPVGGLGRLGVGACGSLGGLGVLGIGTGLVQYGNALSDALITQSINIPAGGLGLGIGVSEISIGSLGLGSGLVSCGNSIPDVTVTQSVAPATVGTINVPVGGLGSGIEVNEISYRSLGLGSGLVPCGNSIADVTVAQSVSPAVVETVPVGGITSLGGTGSINTIGTFAEIPSTVNCGGLGTIGGVFPLSGLGTVGNLGVRNVGIGSGIGFDTITTNVGVFPSVGIIETNSC